MGRMLPPYFATRSSSWEMLRAVAATLSPRSRAANRPFAAESAGGASDEPGLRSHEKSNPEDIGSIPRSGWRHRTVQDEAAAEPCRKRLGRRLALDLIDGCTWVQEGGISVLDVVVGIAHVAADLELDVGVDRAQVSFL